MLLLVLSDGLRLYLRLTQKKPARAEMVIKASPMPAATPAIMATGVSVASVFSWVGLVDEFWRG